MAPTSVLSDRLNIIRNTSYNKDISPEINLSPQVLINERVVRMVMIVMVDSHMKFMNG